MFKKDNKNASCHHHGMIIWLFAMMLLFVLLVLVFQAGIMVGWSKQGHSGCEYSKVSGKKMALPIGKFATKTVALKSAYSDYNLVQELTDSGFIAKDAKGVVWEVILADDIEVYKGSDEEAVVNVGDKVYLEGEKDKDGKYTAELIKIYEKSLKQ